MSTTQIIQNQLDAYNAHNIGDFCKCFTDDIEIYEFPEKLISKGIEAMRTKYIERFSNPELHCLLINRTTQGNTVIDTEEVLGLPGYDVFKVIAIYKVVQNKIAKVYFIYPDGQ